MEEMNIEEDAGKGPGDVPIDKNHRPSGDGSGSGMACKELFTIHVDRVPSALTWAIRTVEILSSRFLTLIQEPYPCFYLSLI